MSDPYDLTHKAVIMRGFSKFRLKIRLAFCLFIKTLSSHMNAFINKSQFNR